MKNIIFSGRKLILKKNRNFFGRKFFRLKNFHRQNFDHNFWKIFGAKSWNFRFQNRNFWFFESENSKIFRFEKSTISILKSEILWFCPKYFPKNCGQNFVDENFSDEKCFDKKNCELFFQNQFSPRKNNIFHPDFFKNKLQT